MSNIIAVTKTKLLLLINCPICSLDSTDSVSFLCNFQVTSTVFILNLASEGLLQVVRNFKKENEITLHVLSQLLGLISLRNIRKQTALSAVYSSHYVSSDM